ncbi:MAG: KH domain-containing protein [Candidatus Micrarchaeota archaeon]
MKIPICELCAQSRVLCSGCEHKLKEGKITEADVATSSILVELKEKFKLDTAGFTKAVDLGRVILIFTEGEVGVLIGRDGKVVSELSHRLGKKVRIAEHGADVKKTISDVVMPARLIGINTVYSGGGTAFKVRLFRSEMRDLPVDIDTLEKAMKSILSSRVIIQFE